MFIRNRKEKKLKTINLFVEEKNKKFFKKKKPSSDKYSFRVNDPYKVLPRFSGYEDLYLIGENWELYPDKPIAIVIGCNDWKYGFITEYLSKYRVAFAPRKKTGLNFWFTTLRRLNPFPEEVFVWGYTESYFLKLYFEKKFGDINRIEDGFIRSAEIGSSQIN